MTSHDPDDTPTSGTAADTIGETMDGPAEPTAKADAAQPPKPLFPDLVSWVEEHFVPVYKRTLGGEFRWCAQWWRHAEAIARLLALWYAWESARLQGNAAMGLWYRDHLDHQLPVLMGARGPFYQCTPQEHLEARPAPCQDVPHGWWDEVNTVQAHARQEA